MADEYGLAKIARAGELGGIFAGSLYCEIVLITIFYLHIIWERYRCGRVFSRLQIILVIYSTIAFLLTTLGLVTEAVVSMCPLDQTCNYGSFTVNAVWGNWLGNGIFLWTSWAADILLLRHFVAVYRDLNIPRQGVVVISFLLQIASMVLGFMTLSRSLGVGDPLTLMDWRFQGPTFSILISIWMIEICAFIQNTMLTCLIIVRLVLHRLQIQKAIGHDHGSKYIGIAMIIVEPQVMLVLGQAFLVGFIIIAQDSIPLQKLVPTIYLIIRQLQVLVPITVIYQVMQGMENDPNAITEILNESNLDFKEPTLDSTSYLSLIDISFDISIVHLISMYIGLITHLATL